MKDDGQRRTAGERRPAPAPCLSLYATALPRLGVLPHMQAAAEV